MGKYKIRETKSGFKFDLLATNGQVIASSQVYKALNSCKKGINSVSRVAPAAGIEDQVTVPVDSAEYKKLPHPKFELYMDKSGEYRFRLKARNGQIVAVSEGYSTIKNCIKGVESVKKNAGDAEIVRG